MTFLAQTRGWCIPGNETGLRGLSWGPKPEARGQLGLVKLVSSGSPEVVDWDQQERGRWSPSEQPLYRRIWRICESLQKLSGGY